MSYVGRYDLLILSPSLHCFASEFQAKNWCKDPPPRQFSIYFQIPSPSYLIMFEFKVNINEVLEGVRKRKSTAKLPPYHWSVRERKNRKVE